MEEKLSGIVLGRTAFGENDMILNIFTIEKGLISAKIKGVKKAGAKLKFAAEPFCFAEFIFLNKNDFRSVIGASLLDSFYPIREDLKRYYSATVVLEYIKRFLRENIVSKDLFYLSINTLKRIAYDDEYVSHLVYFLIEGLKLSGYALKTNKCFSCDKEIEGKVYFDYKTGGFYCEDCFFGSGREINFSTYKTISLIDKMEDKETKEENSIKDVLSQQNLLFSLKLLDYYLENKTEEKINSLKELIKIL